MSRKSSSTSSTAVTTNTATTIGDVGLTGERASELVTVIEAAGIEREKIAQTNLGTVLNFAEAQAARTQAAIAPEGSTQLERAAPWIIGALAIAATAFTARR